MTIFDQSSAHASLSPNALKAFKMNKGNGGKQPRQKDTVIPETNPIVEHHGKIQKMTTEDGKQKGLEQTLYKRRFNVNKMCAKCTLVCLGIVTGNPWVFQGNLYPHPPQEYGFQWIQVRVFKTWGYPDPFMGIFPKPTDKPHKCSVSVN